MVITINLEVDDINCYKIGNRFGISVNDNLIITLTPEAAETLISDIAGLKSDED